ncbi:MAG: DUF3592 domain-containing protein [Nocardiopsaceae bacterium]|nr:DUF3592 domain-containing protein [Nocardiopsaceae bacterium]
MFIIINAVILGIGALLLAFDLLVGFVLTAVLARSLRLAVRGTETTGEVIRIGQRQPGRGAPIRVAYTTPAGSFETRGTSARPRLGAPVQVRYHPSRPASATTLTRPWRWVVTGVPMVLAIAATSAGMVTGAVWYFAGIHSRLQFPLANGSLLLLIALGTGYYAVSQSAVLLRWRRMVRVDGKILRFDEHAPGLPKPGILVSFESADGTEEFWAMAGSGPACVGDTVTVYYNPDEPATSATVEEARTIRGYVIFSAVLALACGVLGIFSISLL